MKRDPKAKRLGTHNTESNTTLREITLNIDRWRMPNT